MSNEFIVGRKPVIEALKAGTFIEKIYILHGSHGESVELIRKLARQRNVLCAESDKDMFNAIPNESLAQGVMARVGLKQYVEIENILSAVASKNESPFLLVFDEIEDPHNLGALIRSAVCFGVHGGIIPKHHSASINPTVVKTSAGASEHFLIAKVTNIVSTLDNLKSKGVWIIGADAKGEKSIEEIDFTMPLAIVIGNEGKGIRRLVKEQCDFLVRIPMAASFDSLNASVAGALLMYEVAKCRMNKK